MIFNNIYLQFAIEYQTWYNPKNINSYQKTGEYPRVKTQNDAPFYLVPLMLLGVVGVAYGAGGKHPDPLRAINASGHTQEPTAQTEAVPAPASRHYSPLDAMSGRMVLRKPPHTSTHMQQRNRKPSRPSAASPHPVSATIVPPKPKRASALDMLSGNPKKRHAKHPHAAPVIPTLQVVPAPPSAPEPRRLHRASVRATPDASADRDLSEIGSESPMPHVTDIPLVAVPGYKTTPVPPAHPRRTTAPKANGSKILFLTFDDGPLKGTANLLRVIKAEGVKATMFYIGRNVVRSPALFHRALAMPNVLVANHTYTHANNHYQRFYRGTALSVVHDIDRAQTVIGGAKYLRLCGRDVWRLPHVHRNDWAISVAERGKEISKYDALANRGYFIYGWDIEWLFSHKTQRPIYSGAEMARRVNLQYRSGRTVKKGKIILLAHDFMWRSPTNVRQLRTFIRIMKAEGWTFKTIDAYSDTTPAVYVRTHKPVAKPKVPSPEKLAEANQTASPKQAVVTLTIKPKPTKPRKPSSMKIKVISPEDLAMQLSNAIRKQQFLRIRKLLAHGAKINGRDPTGEIPLNLAIKTNNAVLVRMLVKRGANIFGVDANGMSPMGIAREHHNTVIIRYLTKQIAKQKQHKLHKRAFSMEA